MQTIQTIIGPKASRTRDLDGAFENDGEIGERDQGRAWIAVKQDVSKNKKVEKDKKIIFIFRYLSNLFWSLLLIFILQKRTQKIFDREKIDLRYKYEESAKTLQIIGQIGIQRKRCVSSYQVN